MKWSDVQFNPTNRVLRQFAAAWLVVLLAWATHEWLLRAFHIAGLAFGVVALIVGLVGLAAPQAIRWLYVGCMIAAFPIGWVLSQIMLAVLFYCVITPVAVVFRLRGRDALRRARSRDGESYWLEKSQPEDLRRYFRQY